jgi:hypothetical protein
MSKDTPNLPSAPIPSGFGQVSVVLPEQTRTPYVGFIYAKTNGYNVFLQKISDLREGEPVLVLPAPADPRVLRPFEYFLLNAVQFWATYVKTTGEMIDMSTVKQPSPYKETIEAVVLVVGERGLVPAQVRFKATTCPAVYPALRALEEAKTTAWAKKGADYVATLEIPEPWGRFVTRANRTERTNRETNERYATMEAVSNPTSAANKEKLYAFFQHKPSVELLREVQEVYTRRLLDARKHIKKDETKS